MYLDPSHEGRGYCGTAVYEDEDGSMTLGSSIECSKPIIYRMTFSLNIFGIHASMYGGEVEHVKLGDLLRKYKGSKFGEKVDEINEFMWSCLFKGLNKDNFKEIIEEIQNNSFIAGKNQMRNDFKNLLMVEY